MRFCHMFTDNARLGQALCVVCCAAGVLCLPSGVLITVGGVEYAQVLVTCLGVVLLLSGVFLIEFVRCLDVRKGGRDNQESATGQGSSPKGVEAAIEAVVMQALVILLFGLVLDGGVRLSACLYSCLGYWAGALLVFARRGSALTWGDRLYLRWGWLPIIVIGTVLFLRVWRYKGLI